MTMPSTVSAGDEDSKDAPSNTASGPTGTLIDSTAALIRTSKIARGPTVDSGHPCSLGNANFRSSSLDIYPVWEGRFALAHTAKGVWYDISGQRGRLIKNANPDFVVDGVHIGVQGDDVVAEKKE
ncbi:hypothetical protein V1522DRAFT_430498 [Lipomyces starkeyi]